MLGAGGEVILVENSLISHFGTPFSFRAISRSAVVALLVTVLLSHSFDSFNACFGLELFGGVGLV